MITGPKNAEQFVRRTFGIGAVAETPVPSQEERKVHMPKTKGELLAYLKRARRNA